MKVEPQKIMSYFLRISFCIFLISIWAIWLITLPEVQVNKNLKEKIIQKEKSVQSAKTEEQDNKKKPTEETISKTKSKTENKQEKIVTIMTEEKKPILANNNPTPKPSSIVNLSNVALTTKKELLKINASLSPTPFIEKAEKIALRKEVLLKAAEIENSQAPQDSKNDLSKENLREDWLPKYLSEKKEIIKKIEHAGNNLDQIVNQLEVKAIISTSDGSTSALIKNNLTNKTETLKTGDEYLNLRIFEINKNEVVF